jgi:hypothetical protein
MANFDSSGTADGPRATTVNSDELDEEVTTTQLQTSMGSFRQNEFAIHIYTVW